MRERVPGGWIEEVTHTWLLGRTATINGTKEVGIITKVINVTPDVGEAGFNVEVTMTSGIVCHTRLEDVSVK